MIVRISGENQYRIPDEHQDKLNDLDNAVVDAVEKEDEDRFYSTFEEMLQLIRDNGVTLDADDLHPSDVIVPPADLSFSEAHHEFNGEGLIPD